MYPFFSAAASTCLYILVVLFLHALSQCKLSPCPVVTANTLFIFAATIYEPSVAPGYGITKSLSASNLLALSNIISRTGKGTDFTWQSAADTENLPLPSSGGLVHSKD